MKLSVQAALLSTAAVLLAGGCDDKASTPQPSGAAVSGASGSASGSASASAPGTASQIASAAASSKPLKTANPKEYTFTEEQALGTLPEGVGIAVGQQAPDFELADNRGNTFALKNILAKGPTLLVFYRGGW